VGAITEFFSIQPLYPGQEENDGSLHLDMQRLDEQRIIVIEHGGGEFQSDGRLQAINGPWILIMAKHKKHLFRPDPGTRGWIIRFQESLFPIEMRLLYTEFFQASNIRLHHTDFRERVLSLIRCIAAIYAQGPQEEARAIPHIYYGFILLLQTKLEKKAVYDWYDRPLEQKLFVRFLGLIEQYGPEFKTVGFYSDRLQIPPQRLRAICKQSVGKSPLAVIEDRRITEAKRLLGNSDMSIKEIASALGYRDPAYFSRIFQKLTGKPPRDFRS